MAQKLRLRFAEPVHAGKPMGQSCRGYHVYPGKIFPFMRRAGWKKKRVRLTVDFQSEHNGVFLEKQDGMNDACVRHGMQPIAFAADHGRHR
jgi:hypothetical protein